MRKWHGIALLVAVSGLLAACGGGGRSGTTATSTTPTTAATTTLAPGETARLAEIMSKAPPGYQYDDPPSSLSGEIQSVYGSNPSLAKVVKGF
ncbi:MAG TPA: hypothetical protein VFH70_04705, partial [Acidimicrobiales bacterium]|nr:hypothetical protein [Acidimicrobiales bacterium]